MVLRSHTSHVVKYCFNHGGGEFCRAKTKATGEDDWLTGCRITFSSFANSAADIKVKRLASSSRFFGTIKNGDTLYR